MSPRSIHFTIMALVTGSALSCSNHTEVRTQTPYPHEAYVWQRQWSDALTNAITLAAPALNGVLFLAGEAQWKDGVWMIDRITPDAASLKESSVPASMVFRIGYCPQDIASPSIAHPLLDAILAQHSQLTQSGISIKDVQIDYDCPESRLTDYSRFLAQVSARLPHMPLSITALPCWLGQNEFEDLIKPLNDYVLQLHVPPQRGTATKDLTVFDPDSAYQWIQKADRIDKPFRVALPTYTYSALLNSEGLESLTSTALTDQARMNEQGLVLASDPMALRDFVREVSQRNYAHLSGFIWFRLPLANEGMNWPWETLNAVINGADLTDSLHVSVLTNSTDGILDVFLRNTGNLSGAWTQSLSLTWDRGILRAGDALLGGNMVRHSENYAIISPPSGPAIPILPGESLLTAWCRFGQPSTFPSNLHASLLH